MLLFFSQDQFVQEGEGKISSSSNMPHGVARIFVCSSDLVIVCSNNMGILSYIKTETVLPR